jgi:hypothetical protein
MSGLEERAQGGEAACLRHESRPAAETDIADIRFRTLIGEEGWSRLPEPVRRRFSKRLADGETAIYRGHVVATELSRMGRVLAFLARAIGGPLPVTNGATGPALVAVTEDKALRGQSWTRIYTTPGRFPHVVHSVKRFCGPTGIEEYVGCGIGMTLSVTVDDGALTFRSQSYYLELRNRRVHCPRLLEPGIMEIVHRDEPALAGEGGFSFRLTLTHRRFGCLIRQLAYFRDS